MTVLQLPPPPSVERARRPTTATTASARPHAHLARRQLRIQVRGHVYGHGYAYAAKFQVSLPNLPGSDQPRRFRSASRSARPRRSGRSDSKSLTMAPPDNPAARRRRASRFSTSRSRRRIRSCSSAPGLPSWVIPRARYTRRPSRASYGSSYTDASSITLDEYNHQQKCPAAQRASRASVRATTSRKARRSSSPARAAASARPSRSARPATAPTSSSPPRRTEPHPKLPGTIHTAAEEIEKAGGQGARVRRRRPLRGPDRRRREAAVEKFGGIDILVNNASAISLTGTVGDADEALRPDAPDQHARHVRVLAGVHPAPARRRRTRTS